MIIKITWHFPLHILITYDFASSFRLKFFYAKCIHPQPNCFGKFELQWFKEQKTCFSGKTCFKETMFLISKHFFEKSTCLHALEQDLKWCRKLLLASKVCPWLSQWISAQIWPAYKSLDNHSMHTFSKHIEFISWSLQRWYLQWAQLSLSYLLLLTRLHIHH